MRLDKHWKVDPHDRGTRLIGRERGGRRLGPAPVVPTEGESPQEVMIHMLGPAPCDDCESKTRCASELLACSAYAQFLLNRPWALAPRVDASHERYCACGLDKAG